MSLGRYELALKAYSESLQIRRDLKTTVGATPQVLRDLSIALNNVADINYYLENYGQALDSYNESLQIFRELKNQLGTSPQVLNDLALSLQNVGDCYYQMQQSAQALACYQECLPLLERLHAAQSFDDGYSRRIDNIKAIIEEL
jgi:tetratricopeptide (TPR) repeat protein